MLPRTTKSFLSLSCGMGLGFLFCSTLLFIYRSKRLQSHHDIILLENDPHAPHKEHDKLAAIDSVFGQMDFNLNDKSHQDEDDSIANEVRQRVRVLCWIMTAPKNLEIKTRHVKATWTRHCNTVLFMSSEENAEFPTIGLKTDEGREQLYWKTIRAFQYIHKHNIDDADWFLKADDDTFVIVDNLRLMLSNYTPEQPIYFGRHFRPYVKQGYMSGGAGYVLSREALRRFVKAFDDGTCTHTSTVEDLALGGCMEKIGVKPGDSRDAAKRETFHPFVPEHHLIRGTLGKDFWYWRYCYHPASEGPECCSDFSISFHYVDWVRMYVLEYYSLHLRAYGFQSQYVAPLSPNIQNALRNRTRDKATKNQVEPTKKAEPEKEQMKNDIQAVPQREDKAKDAQDEVNEEGNNMVDREPKHDEQKQPIKLENTNENAQ
uniref:glycoprotein-N-acetylgalactosamine 3-beta-galactosyltransferase 1 n=1 Tax=Myxine glutinosa TaxID=7769 RepID=UPI00358E251D